MRPIGASGDWRWHGYRTSLVEIDGGMIESVAGGSHWGGGIEIHAEDQARVGMLMLRRGLWDGVQVLPEEWIAQSVGAKRVEPDLWVAVVVEYAAAALSARAGGLCVCRWGRG